MALANTRLVPKRSAIQPLTGMNTASVSMYTVMPMFKSIGLAPKERAICGIAVAMTVPSRFSMKNAPATNKATAAALRLS